MSDILTVLKCLDGNRASKIHRLVDGVVETEAFRAGYRFKPYELSVNSVFDLSSRLTELSTRSSEFVVRGQWNRQSNPCNRRYKGDNPDFMDVDRQWVCLDVDGYEGTLEHLLAALPPCFHDVTCVYQYSSSYGITKDKLSVHLWYWLDRPVCNASLREFAKTTTMIDPMLFNPVQPHFTASPDFEGFEDPVKDRSGMIQGLSDVVIVPDGVLSLADHAAKIEALLEARRQAAEAAKDTAAVSHSFEKKDTNYNYIMSAIGYEIQAVLNVAGGVGRNSQVWESSCSVGNYLPHLGSKDQQEVTQRLLAAAQVAAGDGWDGGDMVQRGLAQGMESPRIIPQKAIDASGDIFKIDELFERLKAEAFGFIN